MSTGSAISNKPSLDSCKVILQKAREVTLKKWSKAENYGELVHLNRCYLQGALYDTPYYSAPIDAETHELLPGLLRLHDFGIITIGSQPQRLETELYRLKKLDRPPTDPRQKQLDDITTRLVADPGNERLALEQANLITEIHFSQEWFRIQTSTSRNPNQQDPSQAWHSWRQRPFLEIIVPTVHPKIDATALRRVCTQLLNNPEIVAFVTYMYPEAPEGVTRPSDPITGEPLFKTAETSLTDDLIFPVSMFRQAATKGELTKAEWRNNTCLNIKGRVEARDNSCGLEETNARLLEQADCVMIIMAARRWDSGLDLAGIVEGLLVENGFEKSFAVE